MLNQGPRLIAYSSALQLPSYMTWGQVIQLHLYNMGTGIVPTATGPAGDEPI